MATDERARIKAALAEVRRLTGAGEFAAARAGLEVLRTDPAISLLGQITALGLPRQLQAALLRLAKAQGDVLARVAYQFHLAPHPDLLARHGLPVTARALCVAAAVLPVPRVIHQIWIGPLPPPSTTQAWQDHAASQGYIYRLWREGDLRDLGVYGLPVFAAMLARGDLPGAVDVARYAVLLHAGGIYLDCDWYPARRDRGLHDYLPMQGLTLLAEDTPRVSATGSLVLNNSVILTPPGHPVFAHLLAILPEVVEEMGPAPAWWATGPMLITAVARGGPVTVAPPGVLAGLVPQGAGAAEVAARCETVEREDGGLLLAWKPWA